MLTPSYIHIQNFSSQFEKEKEKRQKQQSRGVLRKRCSENMQEKNMQFYRTLMPKCDFRKVALQLY